VVVDQVKHAQSPAGGTHENCDPTFDAGHMRNRIDDGSDRYTGQGRVEQQQEA
jgi:hypothetical protein